MPNFASALKAEILRLARKEGRKEIESIKKQSGRYRSEIAALKRQVAGLEKQQARLDKTNGEAKPQKSDREGGVKYRFSPERLAALRQKLGLSARAMGALVGVSAQTIYHWEAGKTKPRQGQLAAVAAVKALGVRGIKSRLTGK